jgi:8-oxo-dGTP pyrophosphatase MutT (NUDIX family)
MERLDALLAAVVPADDKERADLALMRAQRALLPEPLSRSQPAAHFTGSAVVTDGRRVALVHHRKLGRWLQPGGHVEPGDGDDLLATALREAVEETGCPVVPHPTAPRPLDVDVHPIPSRGTEPAHLHLDIRFLVLTAHPEALREDPEESSGVRWFELDEAIHQAGTAEMKRLLSKARAVLGV